MVMAGIEGWTEVETVSPLRIFFAMPKPEVLSAYFAKSIDAAASAVFMMHMMVWLLSYRKYT